MDVKPSRHQDSASAKPDRLARGHGPARARRLLDQLQQLAGDWLQVPLQRTLDDFANRLFERAEQSRRGVDLQACMDSRESVLQARSAIEQRFMDSIGRALDHIGDTPDTATASGSGQQLSLVGANEQELTAALEKIVARGTSRGGPALFELGYRLAVLIGTPPLEGAAQPLGPQSLARAFHESIAPLELADEHHLQLLTSFDNVVMRNIAPLYEKANQHLLDDGILPQLHAYTAHVVPRPKDKGATAGQAANAPAKNAPIDVLDNLREMLAQRRIGQVNALGVDGQIVGADEMQTALGALQQHCTNITDQATRELRSAKALREELLAQINTNRPAHLPRAQLSGEQSDTIELIAMLFDQLGKQVNEDHNTREVLGGMQLPILRMAVTDRNFFEHRTHPARRLLETITEAAYDWLQAPGGKLDFGLESKLEQLVERANNEAPSAGLYRSLLADIEQYLNMLKLRAQAAERRQVEAMRARERLDESRQRAAEMMAERFAKAEPRGLLRTLLERAWTDVLTLTLLRHGEHHIDCVAQLDITDQLLGLAPVIDREQLQADVQAGLRQIGLAVDEASQVAERLVTAGKDASPAIDNAMSTTELLTLLKQHQRLGEQRAPATHATDAPAEPEATDASTLPVIQAVATEVARAVPASANPAPRATHPRTAPAPAKAPPATAAAPQQPATHVAAASTVSPSAAATVARAASATEKALRQRLAKMPFGTWFEFVDATSGRTTERKLAWYSPMSGQALFVTRRGQRAGQMSLDELAHRMVQGEVREVRATRENMLDRAWRGLTGNLRRAGPPA